MGHSRGGLTTKIHALVDAEGRPIRLKLTEGQAHDGRSAADMFETLEAGHILLADRAYDGDALRAEMAERGAWANIRAMPNRVQTFPFSKWVYRQRNAVERFFNKLNTSELSPPDTTNATTTSSPQSNSLQSASGCDLMSR
jgi:transposase